MTDANCLPCGHNRSHLTEIDNQPVCYVCWLIDSGNYTYDLRTGPERFETALVRLAGQVHSLAVAVAEHGALLHRLLNQEEKL